MLMLSASWMLAVIWFKQPSLKDTPIPMAMDSPGNCCISVSQFLSHE